MRRALRVMSLTVLVLMCSMAAHAATHFPGTTWDTATPESRGMDSAILDQFATAIGGQGIIVKDGYAVKTWGSQTEKFDWASAAKPLISSLVLFAIHEATLSNFDALVDDWGWTMQGADTTMTLRHLSNMVSGYTLSEGPGEAYAYNDYGIALYCRTVQNIFGTTLDAAIVPRLSALQLQDGTLFTSRNGCGLTTSLRDFARIGWWWVNMGNWNGSAVLPSALLATYRQAQVPANLPRTSGSSTSDYLGTGTDGGGSDQTPYGPGIYGMNFWFNGMGGVHPSTMTWPGAPTDTFQANGHFTTEIMTMIPSLNLVVAARGTWGSFEPGNASAGMNQNLALLVSAVTSDTVAPAAPTNLRVVSP